MNTLIKALLLGGGAYLLYRTNILSSLTGGLIPTASGGLPAGSSGSPAATSGGPPAFNSLYSTGQRVAQAAVVDYNKGDRANQLALDPTGMPSATWNAWNFFLQQQTGFGDLPDYVTVTGQPDPNVAMSFSQFWQLISPWLHNNHGLNGLGQDFAYLKPADYIGSGMGQLLGMAGAVNSMYAVPRNRAYNDPRMWGL